MFCDEHRIIKARFRVSHRKPGCKDFGGTKLKRNYIWLNTTALEILIFSIFNFCNVCHLAVSFV
jgi:hypothetical protein